MNEKRTWLKLRLGRGALALACLSEKCSTFRTDQIVAIREILQSSDMAVPAKSLDMSERVLQRVLSNEAAVWTPADFVDLGSRAGVDKALQRLVAAGELRRIGRGLYDRIRRNCLTGRESVPDYRAVIQAVTRRDQVRFVVDGMTAANDLGLTTAVPTRIEVMIDARLRPIKFGAQEIQFKTAAPSRLFWAGRPGMYVVQALHWLQDILKMPEEQERVSRQLLELLADPRHGRALKSDLRQGFSTLPIWMQDFLRGLVFPNELELKR